MTDRDPLRDFVEMTKREFNRMVEEATELDKAFMDGRVGDLIRKYNPNKKGEQEDGDGNIDPAADELEGETGGPEVQDTDST